MWAPDVDGAAGFEVTMVDSIPVLAFRPQAVAEVRWADFHALDLEALTKPGASIGDVDPATPPAALQNRWLNLKDALLVTNEGALGQLLGRVHLDAQGIEALRLVPSFDAFQIIGRASSGGRTAAFSIRLEIRTSSRNPRHVEIDLSHVRLFAFVDIAAPRLGHALARGLAGAISAASPAHVVARGAVLEVDLLEVALAQFLVARGWRLPSVRSTQLMALDWVANRLQLHFSSAAGERALRSATRDWSEATLLDVEPTEELCERRSLEAPSDRAAYRDWLAFRVAARAPDAVEAARQAVESEPAELSILLLAAIAAAEAGAAALAADYFQQAAEVAEAGGEVHDAELAHEAAAVQRKAAPALDSKPIEAPRSSAPDDAAPIPAMGPGDAFEGAAERPPDPARQSAVSEALRLTSALHALPPTAFEESLELQENLTAIHMGLGDWATADGYARSVLRHDPTRISMLEKQTEIHQRLDRYDDAARGYARLSRLYPSTHERAQALFFEGELRRERLGDAAGAVDAYLKSSDLDPAFVPTGRQLMAWFWRSSAFAEVASIGDELARAPSGSGLLPLDVRERVRLAAAAAFAGVDAPPDAPPRATDFLDELPFDAATASAVLCEVAVARLGYPTSELSPVVTRLLAWEREAARRSADPAPLAASLRACLQMDLAAPGAARALGALFDGENEPVRAGVCFTVAVFVEPGDGAAARLAEITAQALPERATDEPPEPGVPADPLSTVRAALADPSFSGSRDRAGDAPLDLAAGERRASWLRTPHVTALVLAALTTTAEKSEPPAPP